MQSNLGTLLCGRLGKKLVSILQRSKLSGLAGDSDGENKGRVQNGVMQCGQPCGV